MTTPPPMRYTVTRNYGQPIPVGEPCFVIRGQDAFAIRAVEAYIALTDGVISAEATGELVERREQIRRWQATHPPKLPD
jgi:hypothetical protein